ncbi:MAG: hypothetical protein R3266_12470, partial [Gemmatimonadota bacterium]|nr:hypothetical protein [Gemmatimonadota bacterium]
MTRCLAKNPHRRFQTADALEAALSAVRADVSGGFATGSAARPSKGHRTRLAGVLAGTIAFAGLAYAVLRDGSMPTESGDDATTLAILPPVAVGADTALVRLAEELVVTLSANLTDLGELRIVDAITVLAHVEEGDAYGLEGGAELAVGLGATAFVIGTLHREGSDVRLDLRTHRTSDRALLDRTAITAPSAQERELSEAATRAVLEAVWEEGEAPAPNIDAISTASVHALRAYMRGEQAFVRGQYEEAIDAFEEAFAADSTFWFAYWRSVYPRSGVLERPADPEILRRVYENRGELPTRDRLLIEASWETTLSERLERLEVLVASYPHYWPAWWTYANALVHYGPYLGYGADDARVAVERTLELNPRFATAWDHLAWIAEFLDDHALAERAVRRVTEIQAGIEAEVVWHRTLRFRTRIHRPDPMQPDTLASFADWVTSEPFLLSVIPGAIVASGAPRLQHRLNRALLATGRSARVHSEIERGDALAWIARGAWDSALVAADRYGSLAGPDAALMAYGLAVVGAAMGAVAPDEAFRRRPREPTGDAEPAERLRAEMAWLDGVLAWAQSDRDTLSERIGRLEGIAAADAGLLSRSLAALAAEADGDRARAAQDLERIEREIADRFHHGRLWRRHPHVTALHRFLAAKWIREEGSDARAAELLTWYEAVDPIGGPWMQAHQVALGAITLPDRAEIAAG